MQWQYRFAFGNDWRMENLYKYTIVLNKMGAFVNAKIFIKGV
jgi:hypothetical protein